MAEMMLDRILERYALPLGESELEEEDPWLGVAVVEDAELLDP